METNASYTERDMVGFGNYLMSQERRELFASHPAFPNGELLEERLSVVHDADIENFKSTLAS